MRSSRAFIGSLILAFLMLSAVADRIGLDALVTLWGVLDGNPQRTVTGTVTEFHADEWLSLAPVGTKTRGFRMNLRETTTYEGEPAAITPGARVTIWYRNIGERHPVSDKIRCLLTQRRADTYRLLNRRPFVSTVGVRSETQAPAMTSPSRRPDPALRRSRGQPGEASVRRTWSPRRPLSRERTLRRGLRAPSTLDSSFRSSNIRNVVVTNAAAVSLTRPRIAQRPHRRGSSRKTPSRPHSISKASAKIRQVVGAHSSAQSQRFVVHSETAWSVWS